MKTIAGQDKRTRTELTACTVKLFELFVSKYKPRSSHSTFPPHMEWYVISDNGEFLTFLSTGEVKQRLRVGLLGVENGAFQHVPRIPFQINEIADSEAPSQEVALMIYKPNRLSIPKSLFGMLLHQQ